MALCGSEVMHHKSVSPMSGQGVELECHREETASKSRKWGTLKDNRPGLPPKCAVVRNKPARGGGGLFQS